MKPIDNYFLINRGLIHSDRWLDEAFSRGQAWVDLIGLAQFEDGHFRVRGIRVDVKRGQLAYSQLTLAKRWRWSRGKVRRFLKELENDQDIVQQNNEVTTLITIVKYDIWQGTKDQCDTTNEQQTDNKRTTNGTHKKNDKELNNDNNISSDILASEPPASPPKPVNDYILFKETWKKIYGKYPTGGATLVDYPIKRLIKAYTLKKVCGAIVWAEKARENNQYIPVINNPKDLEDKWNSICNQKIKADGGESNGQLGKL